MLKLPLAQSVPLHEQVCAPQYRTPEYKTSTPNAIIATRVKLAETVAKTAVMIARENRIPLEEALVIARDGIYNQVPSLQKGELDIIVDDTIPENTVRVISRRFLQQ